MSDDGASAMTEAFAGFVAAAQAAAPEIEERPGDRLRSFLEATLEGAIARHLPGRTELGQQRRRWPVQGFEPYPLGVDIDWRHDGVHAGIEVKVSDAIDSLFDVVKLATALARAQLAEGCCAVAADDAHWARGGPFTEMCDSPVGTWERWSVEQLLAAPAARKAVLVATAPRPRTVPAHVETMAAEPIAMPNAPTHTLRLLAVRPAAEAGGLDLPGRPG